MKKLLILICLFSISFYSCSIRKALSPTGNLDDERTFYGEMINNGKSAGWFNVPAKLIKTTDHLVIYIQTKFHEKSKIPEGERDISLYALNKMAQEFDYYYDDMTNIYGGHTDIDNNSKIVILLMDINVNTTGSRVLGYFNPSDMYGYNEGEILYVDLSSANTDIDKSIGTLIHEFQHLINYSYVISGTRREMDSWLNEALSESTSILFNKTTAESRIGEFNKINYYCFYTWEIPTNISNYYGTNKFPNGLVNYPSASVFMHWLYNKNGNKSDIFKKIAQSSQPLEYMKVLTSAKEMPTLSSISDWGDLLLTWMSNISADGLSPSWNSSLKATNHLAEGGATLYPGAMIIYTNYGFKSSGGYNVTRTNIINNITNIIHLNKDITLRDYASVNTSGVNSTVSAKSVARQNIIQSAKKEEENQIINILLDRNGNIKKR